MFSLIRNYSNTKSPISHKYANHGKCVPISKCFKFTPKNKINYTRFYSTTSSSSVNSIKFYKNPYLMRKLIIKDNKNKSDINKSSIKK